MKNVFHNFIHFSTYTRVESGGKGRALYGVSLGNTAQRLCDKCVVKFFVR
ncbi:hypothetical protein RUMCAL_00471 [Ruminococcus callidus ATCC 27760]|uniref:Uncharacterized protein n=1 Tax=Ruminococcus callidus ATCC 27760 TaxID=411473 RepID=U2MCX5_9FIRM|nr:hypothetical protein RUMCAL_00471 [Ruminococcus callidus ATCC 27760]